MDKLILLKLIALQASETFNRTLHALENIKKHKFPYNDIHDPAK